MKLIGNGKFNTFKDFCVGYLKGESGVFEQLVIEEKKEVRRGNDIEVHTSIKYSVEDLNKIHSHLYYKLGYKKYFNKADFDSRYWDFVIDFFRKRLLKINQEYGIAHLSEKELLTKFSGWMKNQFKTLVNKEYGKELINQDGLKEREFTKESICDEKEQYRIEKELYKKYTEFAAEDDFKTFLHVVDVEEYLTPRQREVYPHIKGYYDHYNYDFKKGTESREKIAEKIGISEQALMKHEKKIAQVIYSLYRQWKIARNKHSLPKAQVIIDLFIAIENVEKFSLKEHKDDAKWAVFIGWLKQNYRKGEATVKGFKDFEKLQANRKEIGETIFDIITDNLNSVKIKGQKTKDTYAVLEGILERNEVPQLTNEQKRNIVYQCTTVLMNYIHKEFKYLHKELENIDFTYKIS
ncbi:hypothetical protein [Geobacillus sp. YHL]|uniref:hypothetical protein n=1 Tax=Geobacillus sp. YHL TaxID=2796117 RepID=UPI001EF037CE|nr:hypothetical protein [Geobacillus sp. YHL]MCG6793832.1 hypothetical protein [Geobacillus sp. YHL]